VNVVTDVVIAQPRRARLRRNAATLNATSDARTPEPPPTGSVDTEQPLLSDFEPPALPPVEVVPAELAPPELAPPFAAAPP
jgi:hypothetical protein